MTRKEQTLSTERDKQIEEASVEYSISTYPRAIGGAVLSDLVYKMNINPTFIAGAVWADKHPNKALIKMIISLYKEVLDDKVNMDELIENYILEKISKIE